MISNCIETNIICINLSHCGNCFFLLAYLLQQDVPGSLFIYRNKNVWKFSIIDKLKELNVDSLLFILVLRNLRMVS